MKNNKNRLSAVEKFQQGLEIAFKEYYHKALSDNAKRGWKKRKRLYTPKIDM